MDDADEEDMAIKTLREIEERLEKLADQWEPVSGKAVAWEIINAIRESRGDEPIDPNRPWSPHRR